MVPSDRQNLQQLSVVELVALCEEQAKEIGQLRAQLTAAPAALSASWPLGGRGASVPPSTFSCAEPHSPSHSLQSAISNSKTDMELVKANARLEQENARYAAKLKMLESELSAVRGKLERSRSIKEAHAALEKRHSELSELFFRLQGQMDDHWRIKWSDQALRQSIPSPTQSNHEHSSATSSARRSAGVVNTHTSISASPVFSPAQSPSSTTTRFPRK